MPTTTSKPKTAVFVLHGKEHTVKIQPGESLLEAALIARIDPPYSCLEGVCATCAAYLEEGEVEQAEGLVSTASSDRTFRTCQAQPKSDFVRINYDKARL